MLLEGRAPLEYLSMLASYPWLRSLPRGDGHPVMVFPGMGANDMTTWPLRSLLQSLGYVTQAWGQGLNFGPRRGVLERCADDIRALSQRTHQPVSLIGWSLGGLYAREMAKELPSLARCVITLGTPFTGHPKATNAWRIYEWMTGTSVADPTLIAQIKKPPPVPTTSIYSRTDGIVAWRCSLNEPGPLAENIEVHREPRRHGHESAGALCGRRSPGAANRPLAAVRRDRCAPLVLSHRRGRNAGRLRMQIAAHGIAIEVEDHGPPSGEPLLLIMGLGMQLIAWPDGFVSSLVDRGFRVIRFDNRDIGLSQSFDAAGVPNLAIDSIRYAIGMKVKSAYTLADMAADSVGVLDALGIARAHVCGASMGGMIAQRLAAAHRERLKSLTLMMTSSGARRLPGPSLKVRGSLISRPKNPRELTSIVEHYVELYGLIGSPSFPADKGELRERFTRSVKRSYRPAGTARQMVAIAADGDRTHILGGIGAPTHVIHGLADPLVPVPAGRDLAARIPGATIDLIDGMGHDLPQELWPRFVAGISAVAARA